MKIDKRFFLCICMLSIFCLYPFPVRASGSVVLLIDPQDASLPVGNQALLQVLIRDGESVNAFDLTIIYDQGLLRLDSWAHGGYLRNLSCVHQVNQPGRLRLACTQVARPEANGDGVLLDLVFTGTAEGVTPVTISEAVLANRQGVQSQPEREHGAVNVLGVPKHTATRTPTATATRTATPSRTPTATVGAAQPTPTPVVVVWTATPRSPGGGAEPGYPVGPLEEQTPGEVVTPGDDATTTSMAGDTDPLPGGDPLPDEEETQLQDASATPGPGLDFETEDEQNPLLAGLLWGLLGASGLAILGMVVILIRKKDAKSEDLLL